MNVSKSLTNLILAALEKSIDGYVYYDDLIHHPGAYAYGYPRNIKKASLSQALKRLRENGFVELISDKQLTIRLTDRGKEKAVLAALKMEDNKWDGKWRLVIFDVPEKRRIARDLLRSKLKQWGFAPWQKSVWVSKKSCTKQLRDFVKQVGIGDWVLVVESDNVGR